jgi:molybdopterin-guanine dinucleotide biosynthesis protein A
LTNQTETPARVSGVILAGGQGRRMGSVDKGLQLLRGRPMVAWVLERFGPQVDEVLINANRNLERYRTFGCDVIPDEVGGFAGPLAGLERGLARAHHELVATVPCDSPFLPTDLIERLKQALFEHGARLAVAKTGARSHPVFALCHRDVHAHLRDFLAGGGRKIDAWYSTLDMIEVAFDDEPDAFSNINTDAELQTFEGRPPPA